MAATATELKVREYFLDNPKGLKNERGAYQNWKFNVYPSLKTATAMPNEWDWINQRYLDRHNNPLEEASKLSSPEMKDTEQTGAVLAGLGGFIAGGIVGHELSEANKPQTQVVYVQSQPGSISSKKSAKHGAVTQVRKLNSPANIESMSETSPLLTNPHPVQSNMKPVTGGGWALPLAIGAGAFTLGALGSYAVLQRPQVIVVDRRPRYRGHDGNYYNDDGTLFYTVGNKPDMASVAGKQEAEAVVYLQNVDGLKDYFEKFKSKFTGKPPPPKKEKEKKSKEKKHEEPKEKHKPKEEHSDEELKEAQYIARKLKNYRSTKPSSSNAQSDEYSYLLMKPTSSHAQRAENDYLLTKMEKRRAERYYELNQPKPIKYAAATASVPIIEVEDDDGFGLDNSMFSKFGSAARPETMTVSTNSKLPSSLSMIEYDNKTIMAKLTSNTSFFTDSVIMAKVKSGLSALQNQLVNAHLAYETNLAMYERQLAEHNREPMLVQAISNGDFDSARMIASKYQKSSIGGYDVMNDTHKFLAVSNIDHNKMDKWWTDPRYQKLLKFSHGVEFVSFTKLSNLPEMIGNISTIVPEHVKIASIVANHPIGTEIGIGRNGNLILYPISYTVSSRKGESLKHKDFFMEQDVPTPFEMLIPFLMRSTNATKSQQGSGQLDIMEVQCLCALMKEKSIELSAARTIYGLAISHDTIISQNPEIELQEGMRLRLHVLFEFNSGVLVRLSSILVKYNGEDLTIQKLMNSDASAASLPIMNDNSLPEITFLNAESKPSATVLKVGPQVTYGGIKKSKNLNLLKTTKGDGIPRGFSRIDSNASATDLAVPDFLTVEESIQKMNTIYDDVVKFNDSKGILTDIKNRLSNYFAIGLVRDLIKTNKPLGLKLWDNFKESLADNKRVALVYGEEVAAHAPILLELGNLSANEIDFDTKDFAQVSGVVQKVMTAKLNSLLITSAAGIQTSKNVSVNIYVKTVKNSGKYRILEIPPGSHPHINISDFFSFSKKDRSIIQEKMKPFMFSIQIGKEATPILRTNLQGCPRTFSFQFDLASKGVVESLRGGPRLTYYSQFIYKDSNVNFKSNKTQKEPALLIVERIHDPNKTEMGYIASIYIIYAYEGEIKVQDDE